MLKLANVTLLTMTNVVFVTLRLFSLKISFSFLELVTPVRNVTKNQVNFATSVVFVTNFQKQKEIYKLDAIPSMDLVDSCQHMQTEPPIEGTHIMRASSASNQLTLVLVMYSYVVHPYIFYVFLFYSDH